MVLEAVAAMKFFSPGLDDGLRQGLITVWLRVRGTPERHAQCLESRLPLEESDNMGDDYRQRNRRLRIAQEFFLSACLHVSRCVAGLGLRATRSPPLK